MMHDYMHYHKQPSLLGTASVERARSTCIHTQYIYHTLATYASQTAGFDAHQKRLHRMYMRMQAAQLNNCRSTRLFRYHLNQFDDCELKMITLYITCDTIHTHSLACLRVVIHNALQSHNIIISIQNSILQSRNIMHTSIRN